MPPLYDPSTMGINPTPCTQDDEWRNWGRLREILQLVPQAGGGGGGTIYWAKAQSNWDDSVTPHRVSVKLCDPDGSNEVGVAFNVLLPAPGGKKPNIVAGNVICITQVTNQVSATLEYSCLSDYLDEPFGSIRWLASGSAPTGWGIMNGVANAGPAGSGLNLTGANRFPRAATSAGGTGGSTSFTPAGTIAPLNLSHTNLTVASGGPSTINKNTGTKSYAGTAASSTALSGVFTTGSALGGGTYTTDGGNLILGATISSESIPPHGAHRHKQNPPVTYNVQSGSDVIYGTPSSSPIYTDYDEDSSGGTAHASHATHSHTIVFSSESHTHAFSAALGHSHTFPSDTFLHSHTVNKSDWDHDHTLSITNTELAHSHTATVDNHNFTPVFTGTPATVQPPYMDLIPIERLDNSL